jgi:hypothetical protein
MANESEKSEKTSGDDDPCKWGAPIGLEIEKLYSAFAAKLIAEGEERELRGAAIHVNTHVLEWAIENTLALAGNDVVRAGQVIMAILAGVAKENGIDVETHIVPMARASSGDVH